MGMYTELVFRAEFPRDLPENIDRTLHYLFNGMQQPSELPDHDFFKKPRHSLLGRCSSFYHVPFALSKYEYYCLFTRSDIKNYDREIESFLDWIYPYAKDTVSVDGGGFFGWVQYEEEPYPRFILNDDGGFSVETFIE